MADTKDTGYLTWHDEPGKALALAQVGQALQALPPAASRQARAANSFFNVAPHNVSVRDGFDRRDYDAFRRPGRPAGGRDLTAQCMQAYDEQPIVSNVIDLMADFTVAGIDVTHPSERIEKFHKEWWRRVQGAERSERFANYLYRCAQVVVNRHTAVIPEGQEVEMRRAATASPGPDIAFPQPERPRPREIPMRYTFLCPTSVDLIGGEAATFLGPENFAFSLRVPDKLARMVNYPKSPEDRAFVSKLPKSLVAALASGSRNVPLDPEKVSCYYYKRDDWRPWARPLVAPLLPDLAMLEKMKLADMAALDGAMSAIRVWKLGNLDAKIMPSPATILRLAEMLNNNIGGGVMDLVWGPDIELAETSSEVHRFLGETKYAPVLRAIFQGLGVPATLAGESDGGFTNNYISLKTLVERLQYGRAVLAAFWAREFAFVAKAMGFRTPATLVFDQLLTDEAAEKKLLLDMADRDLISMESLQERFGLTPEIEAVRMRRELRRRRDQKIPRKAGPFHNAGFPDELTRAFAASGAYAPSEFGVELQPGKPGEKSPMASQPKPAPVASPGGAAPAAKPKGQPGQGRPKLSRDQRKRKQKVVKPRRAAAFVAALAQAEDSLGRIARLVTPAFLQSASRKNMRELTDAEASELESFKFSLLCQLPPGQTPDEGWVAATLSRPMPVAPGVSALLRASVDKYVGVDGRQPPVEVLRLFQASVWALDRGEYGETTEVPGDGAPEVSRAGEEPGEVA